jgi:hypothetical protein
VVNEVYIDMRVKFAQQDQRDSMKKRSASYPGKNLKDTESFVITVFEKAGDAVMKYDDLAKQGGVPLRQADSYASTANQYGWMTQVRGKGYSPNSAICKALRTPHSDAEKKKIYLDAFKSPSLYKKIIIAWNGKKITDEGLKISLIRDYEFTDGGAVSASQIFLENAKFLGLIDADGNFNSDAEVVIDPESIKEKRARPNGPSSGKKTTSDKAKQKQEESPKVNQNLGGGTMKKIPIFVRGQELHLTVLEDMNQSDWEVVLKTIQTIKFYSR